MAERSVAPDFGPKLRAYREAKKYTQDNLGVKIGFSGSAISKWEKGKPISAQALIALCDFFKITGETKIALFKSAGLQPLPSSDVMKLYARQKFANVHILAIINSTPNLEKAQLIQYSGTHVQGVLEELIDHHIPIQLTLQHPNTADDKDQKDKICTNVKDFYNKDASKKVTGTPAFEIRFYRDIATVRGVRLDDEIFIGYYTYESNKDKKGQVHGEDNFVQHFPAHHPDILTVRNQFSDTFQALYAYSQCLNCFLAHREKYLKVKEGEEKINAGLFECLDDPELMTTQCRRYNNRTHEYLDLPPSQA